MAGAWCVLCIFFSVAGGATGDPDFFDDHLVVPDSDRFRQADYQQSQVGLSFGVDKRLSYETGRYGEAVQRFEQALEGYRFKAEIWVYLARAHFYTNAPAEARRTLEEAARVMPDLSVELWDPLLRSLLQEIRRRADRRRMEMEFYVRGPDEMLSLFRMYTFLPDFEAAAQVIRLAEVRGMEGYAASEMGSPARARAGRADARRWFDLARQLRAELEEAGVTPPSFPEDGVVDSLESHPEWPPSLLALQCKIDFYSATAEEYRRLYDLYESMARPDRAARVLADLEREVERVQAELQTAGTGKEAQQLGDRQQRLQTLLGRLRGTGEGPDAAR